MHQEAGDCSVGGAACRVTLVLATAGGPALQQPVLVSRGAFCHLADQYCHQVFQTSLQSWTVVQYWTVVLSWTVVQSWTVVLCTAMDSCIVLDSCAVLDSCILVETKLIVNTLLHCPQ